MTESSGLLRFIIDYIDPFDSNVVSMALDAPISYTSEGQEGWKI